MIDQLSQARAAYIQQHRDLSQQMKDALNREEVRDRMREQLDQWRQAQSEFRQQLRDRVGEMREQLQSELGKVVAEGAREAGRN